MDDENRTVVQPEPYTLTQQLSTNRP